MTDFINLCMYYGYWILAAVACLVFLASLVRLCFEQPGCALLILLMLLLALFDPFSLG